MLPAAWRTSPASAGTGCCTSIFSARQRSCARPCPRCARRAGVAAGLEAPAGRTASAAATFGVIGLTRALAEEAAGVVGVTCVLKEHAGLSVGADAVARAVVRALGRREADVRELVVGPSVAA